MAVLFRSKETMEEEMARLKENRNRNLVILYSQTKYVSYPKTQLATEGVLGGKRMWRKLR